MIAGWIRMIGHVTPDTDLQPLGGAAIPPITDHTNGEWPCASVQGWKWSEINTKSKPAPRRSRVLDESCGPCSSEERA